MTRVEREDVERAVASAVAGGPAMPSARPLPRDSLRSNLAYRFPAPYRLAWVALAALVVLSLLTASETLNDVSLRLVGALAGVLMIAAIGQVLVIIVGGFDLSVPAIMTFAATIVAQQTGGQDSHLLGAVLLALLVGVAAGLLSGYFVAFVKLNPVIVTLAIGGIVAGVMQAQTDLSQTNTVPPALIDFASAELGPVSAVFVVGVLLALLVGTALRRTRLGRSFVAVGTNHRAAEVIGIRARAWECVAYGGGGLMYAAAGVLLASLLESPNSTLGSPYTLLTIVAVALGGARLGGGPASLMSTAAACVFLVLLDQYLRIQEVSGGVRVLAQGVILAVAVAVVNSSQGGHGRLSATARRLASLRREEAQG